MTSLTGVGLITGAASGIGRATAHAFARAGCSGLYLIDLDEAALATVSKECAAIATHGSFRTEHAVVDVSKEEAVFAMVTDAHTKFGRLDYAANCAGIRDKGLTPLADMATKNFDFINSVNTRGLLHCVQAEVRAMRGQELIYPLEGRPGVRGSIVNIASVGSIVPVSGQAAYTISKHAVIGITRSAAVSHSKDAIRVNAVLPGPVDTPLLTTGMPEAFLEDMKSKFYQNRLGKPEEIADVIVFLSSPYASFVNSSSMVVNGGGLGS